MAWPPAAVPLVPPYPHVHAYERSHPVRGTTVAEGVGGSGSDTGISSVGNPAAIDTTILSPRSTVDLFGGHRHHWSHWVYPTRLGAVSQVSKGSIKTARIPFIDRFRFHSCTDRRQSGQ
jgi:hypothetical protein